MSAVLATLAIGAIVLAAPRWPAPRRRRDGGKPKRKAEAAGGKDARTSPKRRDRYCANVAPSIAEARIAWQTKRLNELDAQIKQRIADLEKAEADDARLGDQARRAA